MKPTLLVLAAGMGSRYGGLKQMDPMGPNGETVLDYSVFDAIRAGFGRVVFIIREDFAEAFQQGVGSRFADRHRGGLRVPETRRSAGRIHRPGRPRETLGHRPRRPRRPPPREGILRGDQCRRFLRQRRLRPRRRIPRHAARRNNRQAHYAMVGYPLDQHPLRPRRRQPRHLHPRRAGPAHRRRGIRENRTRRRRRGPWQRARRHPPRGLREIARFDELLGLHPLFHRSLGSRVHRVPQEFRPRREIRVLHPHRRRCA